MSQFVDYLSVAQEYEPGTLPLVGSEMRSSWDIYTGELKREQVIGFQHEGSFDSSIHVRSDGCRIAVSGNPSAFDRPENLYGYTTVQQAFSVINAELSVIGLPKMTVKSGNEGTIIGGGAFMQMRDGRIIDTRTKTRLMDTYRTRISRVDVTENIATSGAVEFLRHLSSYVHHGKAGNLYPNGRTVDWGRGSRRVYQKYYDKAWDISLKIREITRHMNSKRKTELEAHIAYLEKCRAWCEQNGIVRRETSFKSTEIIDRNMTGIDQWGVDDMTNVIRPYQFHKKINVEQTRFTDIYETLIDMGTPPRQAKQAELILNAWLYNQDYKRLCGSKTTFYRYRAMLLHVGVDISIPCDISRITLRASRSEWHEIQPPSWYIMPGQDNSAIIKQAA